MSDQEREQVTLSIDDYALELGRRDVQIMALQKLVTQLSARLAEWSDGERTADGC